MKLEWRKRAKCREILVAKVWTWESTCGRYRVERHKFTQECKTYPDVWFAMHRGSHGPSIQQWDTITKHRTRAAAEKACQQHVNHQEKSR